MKSVSLRIDGMMCDGCVKRVEKLLRKVAADQVQSVTIGAATLQLDDNGPGPAPFVQVLESAGYQVEVL